MIRVVIVDDHPSTAMGLSELLGHADEIEVVATADDVDGAVALLRTAAPDVVLCDIQLQGEPGGFEVLRRLDSGSHTAVLFLSSFDYQAFQQRALELGARGYLLKTASVPEVVAAIRRVAAGGTAFTASAIRAGSLREPSERELELIRLVRMGFTNDEAAVRLGIGTRGVESSLRRLFQRYGLLSRTELVRFAEERGWLALPR